MSMLRFAWVAVFVLASAPLFADDPPANASGQVSSEKSPAKPVAANSAPAPKTNAAKTKTNPAKPNGQKPNAAKSNAAKPVPLSAEREAAAIAFAREHHPELAALIDKLRHDNRRDYDRALRELSQASERLMRLKKQLPDQYELSLAAWKLDSRAQLLAARMTVSQSPGLEAELKRVLIERADIRLKEYKSEYARLQDRMAKLKTSIQAIETDKTAVVEKDLLRIKRSVARSRRPTPRPSNKPTVTEPPRPPATPTTASVRPPAETSAGSRAADKQQ
ncbi:MAG TPA: hypothetical protein VGP63_08180 [Planctomycetaceae bacterium]|jgi:hypothetical protein|nr:hypothetical protein [Planctomycetaceae bacterium]